MVFDIIQCMSGTILQFNKYSILSFDEKGSGHAEDIRSLTVILGEMGIATERFVLTHDLKNASELSADAVILVMNISMAITASRALKKILSAHDNCELQLMGAS